jgi:hypothetical protein
MAAQSELHKAHRDANEKYIYFLLAAAGACIAFAISQTQTATISIYKAPLAAAVVFWGLSFYFGCRQLLQMMNMLQQNYQFLRMQAGTHPEFPPHPDAVDAIGQHLEELSNKSGKYGSYQFKFLILGAVFFIGWHVLEMTLRTS